MASKNENFDEMLTKLDEIVLENIVTTLRYGSESEVQTAMKQADHILATAKGKKDSKKSKNEEDVGDEEDGDLPKTKTGFSKTSINKAHDYDQEPNQPPVDTTDQKAFMAALEKDAEERYQRKKEARKEADQIKERGNDEFRQGNYEKALELYTEALTKTKDHTALWTNRAQANIKLGKYQDALSDCDWALRVCPNCLKAYIHMARAHCALKHYDKAREWYRKAWECDPKKENMIKDYLAEVDRLQATDVQETKAKDLFDSGDLEAQSVVELLEKIKKPDQLPLYYSGGFTVITSVLQKASPKSLSQEELDMLTAGVNLMIAACNNNDANQVAMLKVEGLADKILKFLEVKLKGQGRRLKVSCVNLLYTVSMTDVGRSTIVATFDVPRLLTTLFNLIRTNSEMAYTVGLVLNKIVLEKKAVVYFDFTYLLISKESSEDDIYFDFTYLLISKESSEDDIVSLFSYFDFTYLLTSKESSEDDYFDFTYLLTSKESSEDDVVSVFEQKLRDRIESEVLPAFEALIKEGGCQQSVLPSCISTMISLSHDKTIRSKLSSRKELWKYLGDLLEVHKERLNETNSISIVENTLGLLANLTLDPNQYLREFGVNICKNCLAMCKKYKCYQLIISRSLKLMSHILPNCIPSVDYICEESGPEYYFPCILSEIITDNCQKVVSVAEN
ncbi:hypothetical protein KUTeg_006053 [Tegillarca granosa]|uniref:Tetratricopeptide repeat protein 12 n=1 Tax=Tegillarca granosa TaxID=220873 RepID=A0ABQ9FFF5_TEGGR|nr:hypothetical protein KUTeg_006053 [Tegillarca granosa]